MMKLGKEKKYDPPEPLPVFSFSHLVHYEVSKKYESIEMRIILLTSFIDRFQHYAVVAF